MSEVKKIYLCKPNLSPICYLNGVETDSVNLNTHVKDFDELTFTVDRYVNINGELVESNGYDLLNVAMYLYIEGEGYFRMEYPAQKNDGTIEQKEVSAYSIQKEIFNSDWVGLKINTAQEDSQEMLIEGNVTGYAMPINLISFYNPYDERFSLLNILMSKVPLWEVGYVDPHIYRKKDDDGNFVVATKKSTDGEDIEQSFTFSGSRWTYNDNGEFEQITETVTEPKYQLRSVGVYDESNISVYAFLTSTLGPKIGALFFFDTEHRLVHAVSKYSLEHDDAKYDTGIFVGFRNLANNVDLSVEEDSVVTRINCVGDDDLTFLDLNYGSTRLIDLSYFAHEPYMTDETAAKVLDWQQQIENNRAAYKILASEAIDINDQITDITYKVPSDGDYWRQWDGMNEEGLNKSLAYYENQVAILQESVDDSPKYDSDGKYIMYNSGKTDEWYITKLIAQKNGYGGHGTYYETVTYIIPNIKIALNNLNLVTTDSNYQDYIEQLDYDWELYGIAELENQIKNLQGQYKSLVDFYGDQWPDDQTDEAVQKMAQNAWNKEYYNKQRQLFLKLDQAVGTNGTAYDYLDSLYLKRDGTDRSGNVVSSTSVANSLKGKLSALQEQMAPYKKLYDLTQYFDEDDLAQIYPLLIDTDYSNSNIAMQETDTAASKIDVEQDLLDDCIDKISELSQPQITFTSGLDNLYRIETFKNLRKDLKLLNYIHLAVRDDYVVKLRVIGISWNPCDISSQLTIEFSNMITSRSGRTDFTDIINSQNNRGQKNGITIGANGQIGGSGDSVDYLTNLMEALAGTGIFKKIVKNTVTNPISGVGSNVTEEQFIYAMKTVPGMSRFVLDTAKASQFQDDEVVICGGKLKAGFINANYIAANKIMSPNYSPDKQNTSSVYSTAGMCINLYDNGSGSISAKNFAIDSSGNAYFKGTITSSTIVSSTIKNAASNPTFSVSSAGVITSKNSDGTSVTTINGGLITTNNVDINGGDLNIGNGVFHVDSKGNLKSTSIDIDGGDINIGSGVFHVSSSGALTATSASITGAITATSLSLGNGVTVPYSKVSGTPDLTVYISKDGTVGTTPANGVTGFKVSSAGLLTASNAVIYGTIYASAGKIGGCSISNGSLVVPTANISGTLSADKINGGKISASEINLNNGTFKVTTKGVLTASSATITGEVTATSGKIAGWTIDGKRLYNSTYILNAGGNTTTTINGTSRSGLVLSVGSNFGVSNTGIIYSKSAVMDSLTVTNGSFSGELKAATGSFSGQLKAATGTFKGNVVIANDSGFGVALTSDTRQPFSIYTGNSLLQASDNSFFIMDVGTSSPSVISLYSSGISINHSGQEARLQIGYASDGVGRLIRNSNTTILELNMTGGVNGTYLGIGGYGVSWGVTVWGSDIKLKKDIKDSTVNATDIINRIQHRSFVWKRNDVQNVNGYIAQELQEVLPEAVFKVGEGESETRQIDPHIIIPYITKSIQQLSARITYLENRIKELTDKN